MELKSTICEITFNDGRVFSFDFIINYNITGGKSNFLIDSPQARGYQRGETGLTQPDTITIVIRDRAAELMDRLNQAFNNTELVDMVLFDGKGEKYLGSEGVITTAPFAKTIDESESSSQITIVVAFSKQNFSHEAPEITT